MNDIETFVPDYLPDYDKLNGLALMIAAQVADLSIRPRMSNKTFDVQSGMIGTAEVSKTLSVNYTPEYWVVVLYLASVGGSVGTSGLCAVSDYGIFNFDVVPDPISISQECILMPFSSATMSQKVVIPTQSRNLFITVLSGSRIIYRVASIIGYNPLEVF